MCKFLEEAENIPSAVSSWQKKKSFGNAFKMKRKYSIIDGELYYRDPSSKRAALRNNRKVAKMMDFFDIIYEKRQSQKTVKQKLT